MTQVTVTVNADQAAALLDIVSQYLRKSIAPPPKPQPAIKIPNDPYREAVIKRRSRSQKVLMKNKRDAAGGKPLHEILESTDAPIVA